MFTVLNTVWKSGQYEVGISGTQGPWTGAYIHVAPGALEGGDYALDSHVDTPDSLELLAQGCLMVDGLTRAVLGRGCLGSPRGLWGSWSRGWWGIVLGGRVPDVRLGELGRIISHGGEGRLRLG